MILFFHFICLLAKYMVKNFSKSLGERQVFSDDEEEDKTIVNDLPENVRNESYVEHSVYIDGVLKFFPPVYVQRYNSVVRILKDPIYANKIKKVVDFGCAELGFFMHLKNSESITEILEVDVNPEVLQRNSFKAAPLTSDYLVNKRNEPLDVYILAGSISDYDNHLKGCDAVVAIELIEHLSEEAFKNFPYNIFYRVRPKLAIFTTPNADFNSLFLSVKDIRHEDHKFEWTRKEFFNWTQEVIKQYPEYSTRFYGIGAGPEGTEILGCCSQMVVFYRSDDAESLSTANNELEGINNYKLIDHYKYPFNRDTRSREEKIIHEVKYQVTNFSALETYYNYESNENEIPLSLLKESVAHLCSNDSEFRDILQKNGMLLRKKNKTWFLVHTDEESSLSDQSFQDENSSHEGISENFIESQEMILDEVSWDEELLLESIDNFKTARSLEEFEANTPEPMRTEANIHCGNGVV